MNFMEKINNIKYLYVLSSDNSDLYYEQALLSITSLKRKNPDSFVSLLTDDKTSEYLRNDSKKNIIFNLLDEFKEITFTPDIGKKYRSRWLKTSMRKHIDGDFLFLDCDTIIAEKLKIQKEINLGAVLDIHLPLQKRFKDKHYRDIHIQRDIKCKFTTASHNYFNSGLILCRDIPSNHNFFDLWHSYWMSGVEYGILEDQPSFSMANIVLGNIITELDGTWNCQLVHDGLFYLGIAKIIHYYNVIDNKKNYIFAKLSTYETIKKNGFIPKWIYKFLKHPRAAFLLGNKFQNQNLIDRLFFLILIFISTIPLNSVFFIFSKIKRYIDNFD